MPIVVSIGESAGWLGLSAELWSGIVGAVAGALISGVIAYALQWQAYRKQDRDAARHRAERTKTLALSTLLKVMAIDSSMVQIRAHLKEAALEAARTSPPRELWQTALAHASLPDRVSFDADERVLVMSLGQESLFASFMSLAPHHNSIIDALGEYRRARELLNDHRPSEMKGQVGVLSGSREEWLALRPKMIEADTIIVGVRDSVDRLAPEAYLTLHELISALKSRGILGPDFKVQDEPDIDRDYGRADRSQVKNAND
jgi:hypothetical protein